MTDRKKPTAGFWITVALLAVLVGYPLSIGPACWISSRTRVGVRLIPTIYRPITWACLPEGRVDNPIGAALDWYAGLGASKGWRWTPRPIGAGRVIGEPVWLDCSPDE